MLGDIIPDKMYVYSCGFECDITTTESSAAAAGIGSKYFASSAREESSAGFIVENEGSGLLDKPPGGDVVTTKPSAAAAEEESGAGFIIAEKEGPGLLDKPGDVVPTEQASGGGSPMSKRLRSSRTPGSMHHRGEIMAVPPANCPEAKCNAVKLRCASVELKRVSSLHNGEAKVVITLSVTQGIVGSIKPGFAFMKTHETDLFLSLSQSMTEYALLMPHMAQYCSRSRVLFWWGGTCDLWGEIFPDGEKPRFAGCLVTKDNSLVQRVVVLLGKQLWSLPIAVLKPITGGIANAAGVKAMTLVFGENPNIKEPTGALKKKIDEWLDEIATSRTRSKKRRGDAKEEDEEEEEKAEEVASTRVTRSRMKAAEERVTRSKLTIKKAEKKRRGDASDADRQGEEEEEEEEEEEGEGEGEEEAEEDEETARSSRGGHKGANQAGKKSGLGLRKSKTFATYSTPSRVAQRSNNDEVSSRSSPRKRSRVDKSDTGANALSGGQRQKNKRHRNIVGHTRTPSPCSRLSFNGTANGLKRFKQHEVSDSERSAFGETTSFLYHVSSSKECGICCQLQLSEN